MAVPAIHPGEHIAEELRVLDMSVAAFAGRLKVQGIYELRLAQRNRQWSRLPAIAQDLGQRPNGRGRGK